MKSLCNHRNASYDEVIQTYEHIEILLIAPGSKIIQ